jgi:hypothetical protein
MEEFSKFKISLTCPFDKIADPEPNERAPGVRTAQHLPHRHRESGSQKCKLRTKMERIAKIDVLK